MSRVILSAPTSGAGKTTITLGILRALARRGQVVHPAKSGPDYIDPQFHTLAAGRACVNLDAWAMAPARLRALATNSPLLVEGAMGLFDGAGLHGAGSTADLARHLNAPVILIIDAARMGHSLPAMVRGFVTHATDMRFHGVILNRVGSDRHRDILMAAMADQGLPPILGMIPRNAALTLPERHLGLVQADEVVGIDTHLNQLADHVEAHLDLDKIFPNIAPLSATTRSCLRPPAQRIALAQDIAFAFAYPHMLADWRGAGAELILFSPLNDDPVPDADFVFLPGGYPELHAGRLAGNQNFLTSLRQHAQTKPVYGECGGYMVLGRGLVDANGTRHEMAGLLPLETSFETRKLHLGYRHLTGDMPFFPKTLRGHEFHYATTLSAKGTPLFQAQDADHTPLPPMGLQEGYVFGSFAHIIDAP